MAEQIVLLKQQVQSLTGHWGMGLSAGRSIPGDPVPGRHRDMVNTGVNPGDASQVAALRQPAARTKASFRLSDPSLQSSNPRMIAAYKPPYQAGISGMSAGQGTFNTLATQLANCKVLKDKSKPTLPVRPRST